MQIQNTFEDRQRILQQIDNYLNALDLLYALRWDVHGYGTNGYYLTTRIYDYIRDAIDIHWMIFNAVAAAS